MVLDISTSSKNLTKKMRKYYAFYLFNGKSNGILVLWILEILKTKRCGLHQRFCKIIQKINWLNFWLKKVQFNELLFFVFFDSLVWDLGSTWSYLDYLDASQCFLLFFNANFSIVFHISFKTSLYCYFFIIILFFNEQFLKKV